MSRVKSEDTIVISEMETNPERFFRNLQKLAWIVLHNHYSFVRDYATQEDMVSEAVLKAWELLKSGDFDPTRSTVRNYCYTGMRNQMQNFYYKSCREVSVEEIRYNGEDDAEGFEKSCSSDRPFWEYKIDEELLFDICDRFYRLGNYHELLRQKLVELGMVGDEIDMDPPDRVDEVVLNACFIEYLWRYKNATR